MSNAMTSLPVIQTCESCSGASIMRGPAECIWDPKNPFKIDPWAAPPARCPRTPKVDCSSQTQGRLYTREEVEKLVNQAIDEAPSLRPGYRDLSVARIINSLK